MLRDLRSPAGLLLMVNFALAVAMLTAACAVNETSRRQALAHIPPPGRNVFGVRRLEGKREWLAWRITAADVAAVRQLDQVFGAYAVAGAYLVTAKYGRAHTWRGLEPEDQLGSRWDVIMRGRPPSDGWYLLSGRWMTAAEVTSAALVCILDKPIADELGVREAGVTVRLNGFPFTVIGIRDDPRQEGGGAIRVPMTTAERFGVTDFSLVMVTQDDPTLMEREWDRQLQRIFHTKDRFVLSAGQREYATQDYSRQLRWFLANSSLGLAPIGIALFGALGISVAWARERRWSYALFRALGATRWQVGRAALGGPLWVACGSSTLGLGLGWLICVGLAKYLAAGVAFYWLWLVIAWGAGFAAMLPASLYIALRAAFVPPAAALRQ